MYGSGLTTKQMDPSMGVYTMGVGKVKCKVDIGGIIMVG